MRVRTTVQEETHKNCNSARAHLLSSPLGERLGIKRVGPPRGIKGHQQLAAMFAIQHLLARSLQQYPEKGDARDDLAPSGLFRSFWRARRLNQQINKTGLCLLAAIYDDALDCSQYQNY